MNVGIGKSKIQLIKEDREKVSNLRDSINDFFEHYDTHSMVFGLVNGNPCELESGYLEIEKTFENLNDALYALNDSKMALHVMESDNKKIYRIGHVVGKFDECKCDKEGIFDIKKLKDIA